MLTVESMSGKSKSCPAEGLTVADTFFWAAKEWQYPTSIICLVCNSQSLIHHGIGTSIENLCDDQGDVRMHIVLRLGTCPPEVGKRRGGVVDAIEKGFEAYRNGLDTSSHDNRIKQLYKEL